MEYKSKARMAAFLAVITLAMSARVYAETAQSSTEKLPSNQQVIAFLLQSAHWYRHISVERQIATEAADLIFLADNQPMSVQILRLSFDFAKADAALAATHPFPRMEAATGASAEASSDSARFIEMKNQAQEAIQKTAQQVDTLRKGVRLARGADRPKLQAALDEAQSRLELLTAGSKAVQDLVDFVQSAGTGEGHTKDLASTIDDLVQTLPELNSTASPLAKLQDSTVSPAPKPQQSGILGVASEVSAMNRKLSIIDEALRMTDDLTLSAQDLRTPLAAFSSRVIRSAELSNLQTDDLSRLRDQKGELDALTAELNSWSPALVALDKQKILIALCKSHLTEWRKTVEAQYRQAWKKLIVRVLIVALIIALLAGISEVSGRVALGRIQDQNRRRLLGVAHRVLTMLAIIVVAAFSLASNLSSLVTFFGLATAGVAIALQNVILACWGYLLLVGRRGIRIGDRVQISDVTGYVTDIDLLQFQLREFDVQRQQFTGHLATISNSLIFDKAVLRFNADSNHVVKSEVNNSDAEPDLNHISRIRS